MKNKLNALRQQIELLGKEIKGTRDASLYFDSHKDDPKFDVGEIKANLSLAYRHLEDARMRLGKAIQASEGGESIYK